MSSAASAAVRSRRHARVVPATAAGARRFALLVLVFIWAIVALYDIEAAVPPAVLELPFAADLRPFIVTLAPQGWAFFTRSPREERFLPYAWTGSGWRYGQMGPHAEARNAFGLDRASRAQGVELGLLYSAIPSDAWDACDTEPTICFDQARTSNVQNRMPAPSICGTWAIALQPPLPWAWREAATETIMPSRVVRLAVQC